MIGTHTDDEEDGSLDDGNKTPIFPEKSQDNPTAPPASQSPFVPTLYHPLAYMSAPATGFASSGGPFAFKTHISKEDDSKPASTKQKNLERHAAKHKPKRSSKKLAKKSRKYSSSSSASSVSVEDSSPSEQVGTSPLLRLT